MRGYVLTWNPELWPWGEFADDDAKLRTKGFLDARWSTGNTKRIAPGDRGFLLRQSSEPGLIGSGTALTKVFDEEHWNNPQSTGTYISVRFDQLVTPNKSVPIDDSASLTPDFLLNRVQASGFSIDLDQSRTVNGAWNTHLWRVGFPWNLPFAIGSKYTRYAISPPQLRKFVDTSQLSQASISVPALTLHSLQ